MNAERMTAAERARALAARTVGDPLPPADEPRPVDDAHLPPPKASPDRIRCGVDLTQAHRRGLRRWQDEAADELGENRVTQQDVLEALVARLLTDETLSRKIKADLRTRR